MGTSPCTYITPDTVEAAVAEKEDHAAFLAGGTDLVPLMKRGITRVNALIDLDGIPELKKIETDGETIFIGSMVILSDLIQHPLMNTHLEPIVLAAGRVASPQIRNMGTVGGNLFQERRCLYFNQSAQWRENVPSCIKFGGAVCHQIPASKTCRALYYSDLAPILLAYNAKARLYNGNDYEELPLAKLLNSRVHNDSREDLLTGLVIPGPVEDRIGCFLKYSDRGSIDFASANLAIAYTPGNSTDAEPSIRIFAGAVAPEPVQLTDTEEILLGSLPDAQSQKGEIIDTGIRELESRALLIRETGLPIRSKKNSLLIVAEALREFLPRISA